MLKTALNWAKVPETFRELSAELEQQKILPISGLPHLSCQSYFITSTPYFQTRAILWFVKNEEVPIAYKLLTFWHKIHKIARPIWALTEIKPLVIYQLIQDQPIIITDPETIINSKLPPAKDFQKALLTISINENQRPAALCQKLVNLGYEFNKQASEAGEFARRGGVVDVYPVNFDRPFRIEFASNKIEQINTFNPVHKKIGESFKSMEIVPKQFSSKSNYRLLDYLPLVQNLTIIYPHPRETREIAAEWPRLYEKIKPYQHVIFESFTEKAPTFDFQSSPLYRQNFNKLKKDLEKHIKLNWRIIIASHKIKELKNLCQEKNIPTTKVQFIPPLNELTGFQSEKNKIMVLTDKEIFGQEIKEDSARKKVDHAFIMELKTGDYVVHLDHGIGRFSHMTKNVVEDITKEYFVLNYAEGDKLYVPVETADKISKYIGIAHPKLHRLSGGQWYQLTRKIKQEAKVLAQELLKIYAKREMTKIKPFSSDTSDEKELTESFPYEETPDQAKSIADVKNDLEKETPMDRLICGDVGFGKTEVAVRAAFKAVMNKKQVALLSPTTILTQQHYDTFNERLKRFPMRIGILSRFESEKEQQDTIEKLKSGLIDIVIGTHRLLSHDVNFRNLGLIIIDEEQRFGVKAKEKLKALRTQAHILTLTATPIPRTLNIALSGVRDVSIIETPPEGRLPIATNIEPYSDDTIKKAINNELKRKGQVYYLHNKVETISFTAKQLQKLTPKAKIGIAHGRLPEKDLARAMRDFDTQKTNVLVCSTIIENGLDLPNVNTLIVDNATNFGLAQLYQLRGRIGRSERQAYAYFLYHRKKLKGNAKKRLQALIEAKKLGSGFQLALRDLEIRGAGNILGKEQHGKVSAIGLSLYTRLLAQAIEELKFGKIQEPIRDILIDLPLEAYIPKGFLNEEERLVLYQKMANTINLNELQELKNKIILSRTKEEQRKFPVELLNLFEVLEVRILAQKTDISHIDTTLMTDQFGHKKRRLIIKFLFTLKAGQLAKLLQKNEKWQFDNNSIKINLELLGKDWLGELKKSIRIFQR